MSLTTWYAQFLVIRSLFASFVWCLFCLEGHYHSRGCSAGTLWRVFPQNVIFHFLPWCKTRSWFIGCSNAQSHNFLLLNPLWVAITLQKCRWSSYSYSLWQDECHNSADKDSKQSFIIVRAVFSLTYVNCTCLGILDTALIGSLSANSFGLHSIKVDFHSIYIYWHPGLISVLVANETELYRAEKVGPQLNSDHCQFFIVHIWDTAV